MATHTVQSELQSHSEAVMEEFYQTMSDFPCMFNMPPAQVSIGKLFTLQERLETDLTNESSNLDFEEYGEQGNKHLITLVFFKLGNLDASLKWNDKALKHGQGSTMMCVANRAFIFHEMGREDDVRKCLKQLEEMKDGPEFEKRLAASKAQQAFAVKKFGGIDNLKTSTTLFEKALELEPDNFQWEYEIALNYRRSAVMYPIARTEKEREYTDKAIRLLQKVATSSPKRWLKAHAYAQMALAKKDFRIYPNEGVHNDCKLALQFGDDDPVLLRTVGSALCNRNVDWAIEILQKSLQVRQDQLTLHQLGKCFALKTKKSYGKFAQFYSYEDANVQQAVQFFRKSIKMSHNTNFSAIAGLCNLFIECKQYKDALQESLCLVHWDCNQSVLYNVQGRCHLEMYKSTKAEVELKLAETAFIKAISFDLFTNSTSGQSEVLKALDNLPKTTESERRSWQGYALGQLVQDPVGFLVMLRNALQDKEYYFANPQSNILAIEKCLQNEQFEEALLLLKLVERKSQSKLPANYVFKVLYKTAESRLRKKSLDAKLLYQKAFYLNYSEAPERLRLQDRAQLCTASDVLVLFENYGKDDFSANATGRTAKWLKNVIVTYFGLHVDAKSEVSGADSHGKALQLGQVFRYKALVVLLGPEEDEKPEFIVGLERHLSGISDEDDRTCPRVIVIRSHGREAVPEPLSRYDQFHLPCLHDFLLETESDGNVESKGINRKDDISEGFDVPEDIISLLSKLFDVILGSHIFEDNN